MAHAKGKAASLAVYPGIKGFCKVSENIYRGGQPTAQGFVNLKKMGVKTIVDFIPDHSDEKLIADLGFEYFQIPVKLWNQQEKNVIQFLKIVTSPKYCPVFVHCDNGTEKTGLMMAVYRMCVEDWASYDATKELCKLGMKKYRKNVGAYLNSIDKVKIKNNIGQ